QEELTERPKTTSFIADATSPIAAAYRLVCRWKTRSLPKSCGRQCAPTVCVLADSAPLLHSFREAPRHAPPCAMRARAAAHSAPAGVAQLHPSAEIAGRRGCCGRRVFPGPG